MDRLMVKLGKGFVVLRCQDIDRIQSEKNYLRLHKGERSFLIRNTLENFEKKLDPDRFVRVNRSTILNVERIRRIESDLNYNYFVVMNNDVTIAWGKKFRNNLKRMFQN